tara:strand:- start:5763 stop:6590 length:828 start_codon:yes stop_codon:yes gene_type:complete
MDIKTVVIEKHNGVEIQDRDYSMQPLEVLSCGAGVQSTVLVLKVIEGLLKKPDIIIHANTGSDLPYTYEQVERLFELATKHHIRFEIVRSHYGKLHESYMKNSSLPLAGQRSCTGRFKVDPINQRLRQIVGHRRGIVLANSWLGITTDEIRRRKPNKGKWIRNTFPLLDELIMSRDDCKEYIENYDRGKYNTDRSGCFCCPYGGKRHFRTLKKRYPELFDICLDMEKKYFNARPERREGLCPSVRSLEAFNNTTLEEYGFDFVNIKCEPSGGCFL